jgi:ATP-dependent Clp endopeptidase proteolytic subunit ClpP
MARINKESIDRFYDYDIHVETRTIYMGSVDNDPEHGESGTDSNMAERVIKGLHILDSSAPSGDKPITVLMNNPGGDVYHGAAIYDAIKACKNHVTIVVYGHAMSMGSIILQAADHRVMQPNSRMMVHYGTWGYTDHPKIFQKWADESKKFMEWMDSVYMEKIKQKKPNYTRNQLKELCNFDTILTPEEAFELGLIDEILGVSDARE